MRTEITDTDEDGWEYIKAIEEEDERDYEREFCKAVFSPSGLW